MFCEGFYFLFLPVILTFGYLPTVTWAKERKPNDAGIQIFLRNGLNKKKPSPYVKFYFFDNWIFFCLKYFHCKILLLTFWYIFRISFDTVRYFVNILLISVIKTFKHRFIWQLRHGICNYTALLFFVSHIVTFYHHLCLLNNRFLSSL